MGRRKHSLVHEEIYTKWMWFSMTWDIQYFLQVNVQCYKEPRLPFFFFPISVPLGASMNIENSLLRFLWISLKFSYLSWLGSCVRRASNWMKLAKSFPFYPLVFALSPSLSLEYFLLSSSLFGFFNNNCPFRTPGRPLTLWGAWSWSVPFSTWRTCRSRRRLFPPLVTAMVLAATPRSIPFPSSWFFYYFSCIPLLRIMILQSLLFSPSISFSLSLSLAHLIPPTFPSVQGLGPSLWSLAQEERRVRSAAPEERWG